MKSVDDIDWVNWKPVEEATLLFVIRDGQILLIRKKRGLGAGKINGPGGRIEPGETARACAIREVEEELCITATGVTYAGKLCFQFADGFSISAEIYRASGYTGEPTETGEAIPLWFAIDAIPYEQMWADDEVWMPHLLAGRHVDGRFLFDGDTMLEHRVTTREPVGKDQEQD